MLPADSTLRKRANYRTESHQCLQMLGDGLRSQDLAGACDLLRQLCLLSEDVASNALAEGALWPLLVVLFDYAAALHAQLGRSSQHADSGHHQSPPSRHGVADVLHLDMTAHTAELPLTKRQHMAACAAMAALAALVAQVAAAQRSFLLLGGVAVVSSMLERMVEVCSPPCCQAYATAPQSRSECKGAVCHKMVMVRA